MASFAAGADDYCRALRLVELALSEAGDDGPARAEALAVGAAVDMNLGQMESAEHQAHEALTLFDRLGDRHGSALVLDLEAMRTFLAGHVAAGVAAFEQVAALFEETGDFLRSITPRSTRGHGLVWMRRPADALAEIDRALDVAVDLRHREMRCYCLWHRSEALAALGRVDEATADAETGLRIARELNHREWTAASLRGLGIAQTAAGDLASAETTFRAALDAAAGLPLFESWAAARLVAVALAGQVPLAWFEARVAQAELLVALQADDAASIVRRSLDVAIVEGHLASADRLAELLESCRESARRTTYRRDEP
jgi:tetratricopeptide (TPR) repeat protein